jgi:hypothetical protein
MEKGTSETYRSLQQQLGPTRTSFLDLRIGQILTKSRALAAISIASQAPKPFSVPQEFPRSPRAPRGELGRSLFAGPGLET